MRTINLMWVLSDDEDAVLQAHVAANGQTGETPEAYVNRVAFKGLQGTLVDGVNERRQKAIADLTQAYDAAAPEVQASVLATLGFEKRDGTVQPSQK